MTKESIRVLVVEDHHVVRQGLVALLNVVDGLEVVAQAADGDLIVGRGVPAGWVGGGPPVSVTDFPTTGGRRLDLTISSSSAQHSVSLVLGGQLPSGQVLFQLPSFVDDIASTSPGTVDQATGTVALAPGVSSVTVRLRRAPAHG